MKEPSKAPSKGNRSGHGPGPGGGPGRGLGQQKVRAKNIRHTLMRLMGYLRGQYGKLLLTALSVVLTSLLTVAGPYLLGRAVDVYITARDLTGFGTLMLIMAGVYVSVAFFQWLSSYLSILIAQDAVKDIRADLFKSMQRLSLKFFDTNTDGDLTSRLTNDVDNISNTLNQSLTQLISNFITLVAVVAMMIGLSWQLSLVSFFMIPLIIFSTSQIAKWSRKYFKDKMKGLGELNGHIEETISGQKVVKAYGQEEQVVETFEEQNAFFKNAAIRADVLSSIMGPVMNMMNNLTYALIALIGGVMIIRGMTTVGVVVSFVNYARQFAAPITHIASLYNTVQAAIASAERVFEVIDETPEITDESDALAVHRFKGHVTFDHVDFAYVQNQPVLKDVSFEARPGEMIALVGPTGAGKTTIINLLSRFYDIDGGSIQIDDRPLKAYKVSDLRSKIGIVLQDTYLFTDTVMENIRYGRLDATDEEVMEAAKLANAHQFIHRLPEGYHTVLAGEGLGIAQGQRQLIAIARTILADPDILILDEATSSVDTRTERHIQEGLLTLMEGRTSFVIAHRLSTIENADQILVIKDGRIQERGSHGELLEQAGFYHQLHASQFRTKAKAS